MFQEQWLYVYNHVKQKKKKLWLAKWRTLELKSFKLPRQVYLACIGYDALTLCELSLDTRPIFFPRKFSKNVLAKMALLCSETEFKRHAWNGEEYEQDLLLKCFPTSGVLLQLDKETSFQCFYKIGNHSEKQIIICWSDARFYVQSSAFLKTAKKVLAALERATFRLHTDNREYPFRHAKQR